MLLERVRLGRGLELVHHILDSLPLVLDASTLQANVIYARLGCPMVVRYKKRKASHVLEARELSWIFEGPGRISRGNIPLLNCWQGFSICKVERLMVHERPKITRRFTVMPTQHHQRADIHRAREGDVDQKLRIVLFALHEVVALQPLLKWFEDGPAGTRHALIKSANTLCINVRQEIVRMPLELAKVHLPTFTSKGSRMHSQQMGEAAPNTVQGDPTKARQRRASSRL
mmetsp:Transcript_50338/g.116201  ORF Transcript_50338/g.116201 Transcript_50338/m.116201 type:complete len:229 (+) Transcript_50338:239-925(+)